MNQYDEVYDLLLDAGYESAVECSEVTDRDFTPVHVLYAAYVRERARIKRPGEALSPTHFGIALRRVGWDITPTNRRVNKVSTRGYPGVRGPGSVVTNAKRGRPNADASLQTAEAAKPAKGNTPYISLRQRLRRLQAADAKSVRAGVGGPAQGSPVSRHGPPPRLRDVLRQQG